MTTDLATLTTAAERWDGMAGESEKQETAYRRDVHGISMGTSWTGPSRSLRGDHGTAQHQPRSQGNRWHRRRNLHRPLQDQRPRACFPATLKTLGCR
ncbi:hypothetical protein [Streptomyces sp. NPDC005538]|uniref:hypothetical protein n=1 Tax=unclassified Streptomyces TaxID=2593676 RepID=UPI0033A8A410